MTEPLEGSGLQQQYNPEIFDKTQETWEQIKGKILPMTEEGVEWAEDTPILGQTDEITAYTNVEDAFKSPDTTTLLLRDGRGEVVGYTLSFPFEKMDPESAKNNPKAAYIYFTILDSEHRSQGLVAQLTEPLFEELDRQGYERAVRDSKIPNGYADKVKRHYKESIIESVDHEYWPEVGPQTRFVIDIKKHLADHSNQASMPQE